MTSAQLTPPEPSNPKPVTPFNRTSRFLNCSCFEDEGSQYAHSRTVVHILSRHLTYSLWPPKSRAATLVQRHWLGLALQHSGPRPRHALPAAAAPGAAAAAAPAARCS